MVEDKDKPEDEFPGEKYEHVHLWDILDCKTPPDMTPHPQLRPANVTIVLVRCKTCNLPQTVELQGRWLLQDILRNNAKIEHRDER